MEVRIEISLSPSVKYDTRRVDFDETRSYSTTFFYVSLTVHLSITLANDQLDALILIHLLQSSTCTCFEQYLAHRQEVKLY